MLVPGRELLAEAVSKRHAIGSFNTYNLEITQAILRAAEAQRQPVFLAIGTGALDYAGFSAMTAAMLAAADEASVAVAVHLDHCSDLNLIERCIEAGFTSIMVDGSSKAFGENVALTREAVLSSGGITMEAELGGVAGSEDGSGDQTPAISVTDVGEAERFIEETGVDSLAIAIGNAHGFYNGEPRLDFNRLAALAGVSTVPLVVHGASGIADDDIRRCIDLGVRKINVNTEIRYTLFQSLEASLKTGVKGYDVTKLFGAAIEAMQATVEEKIALFAGG